MADGTVKVIFAALPRQYWRLIQSVLAARAEEIGDSDRMEFDVLDAVSDILRRPSVSLPEEQDDIPEPFL